MGRTAKDHDAFFCCPEGQGGDAPGHRVLQGYDRAMGQVTDAIDAWAAEQPAERYHCIEHQVPFDRYSVFSKR